MGKRMRILIFAAIVAAIVVPVGFALSLESSERAGAAAHGVAPMSQAVIDRSPVVATTGPTVMAFPDVPEGAKLLAIGTALFALAAAMRRTG
jgi:hypothetical protein